MSSLKWISGDSAGGHERGARAREQYAGYALRFGAMPRRAFPVTGRGLAGLADLADLAGSPRTCRWIFPTWPARFLSTCSLQTKRHGQSLFGHFSRRASCFRRSRAKAFSRTNWASRSVGSCGLPFVIISLKPYTSLSGGTCHLDGRKFVRTDRKRQHGPIHAQKCHNGSGHSRRESGIRQMPPFTACAFSWMPFERIPRFLVR